VKKLDAGDYSLEGLESVIAVERKSIDDLINTLLRGKRRFSNELRKLQSYNYACICVEAGLQDISNHNYTSQISPKSLLGMISSLILEYHPVQIIFCDDRPHSYAFIEELLKLADLRYPSKSVEVE
jgi:ERCC4-type nuclease